jgi:hypothetical protein
MPRILVGRVVQTIRAILVWEAVLSLIDRPMGVDVIVRDVSSCSCVVTRVGRRESKKFVDAA